MYSVAIPGVMAGAFGGWLSGSLLVRRIRAAFEEKTKSEVQGTLEWQTAGETLIVVDAPKEKATGIPKSYPALSLGLPIRIITATGVVTFGAAWLIFRTLPSVPQWGVVEPPFISPPTNYPGVTPTPFPIPEPRYAINQQVYVSNLDPSLQDKSDWWVNSYYWAGGAWVYEVRTDDGITVNRTEAQLAPLGAPTPFASVGRYSRERWDWQMPLALVGDTDVMPDGTLVHLQREIVTGQQIEYQVRDFIGRTVTLGENQLLPPEEMYVNPEYVDGMPLFGRAQGRICLAKTLGIHTAGTIVQIQNAYFDTRTDEWFYDVRLPDGSTTPVREGDLTSIGLSSRMG